MEWVNMLMCSHLAIKTPGEHYPLEKGRKLKVHRTFRERPGRFLNILYTINLGGNQKKSYRCVLEKNRSENV